MAESAGETSAAAPSCVLAAPTAPAAAATAAAAAAPAEPVDFADVEVDPQSAGALMPLPLSPKLTADNLQAAQPTIAVFALPGVGSPIIAVGIISEDEEEEAQQQQPQQQEEAAEEVVDVEAKETVVAEPAISAAPMEDVSAVQQVPDSLVVRDLLARLCSPRMRLCCDVF